MTPIQVIENRDDYSTTNWKTPRSDITSSDTSNTSFLKKVKNSPPVKSLTKKKKKGFQYLKNFIGSDQKLKLTNSSSHPPPPISPISISTQSISDGSSNKTKSDDSIESEDVSVKNTADKTKSYDWDLSSVSVKTNDSLNQTPSTIMKRDDDKTPAINNKSITSNEMCVEDKKKVEYDFVTTPVKVTTTGRRSQTSAEKSSRKYVKATPPPPSSTPVQETKPQEDDDNDLPESKRVFGYPSPRDTEILRDRLTEKREDNLHTFTEKNQEKRQELTQKKRLEKKECTASDSTPAPAPPKNKIFSVEPQFPEHKRILEESTSESNDVHLKKPRVAEGKAIKEKDFFSSLSSIPGWAKVVVPVVAVVAIFAINSIRKK